MASVKSRRPYRSRSAPSRQRRRGCGSSRRRVSSSPNVGSRGHTSTPSPLRRASPPTPFTPFLALRKPCSPRSSTCGSRAAAKGSDVLAGEVPQAVRALTDQRQMVAGFAADIAGASKRVRPIDDVMRSAAAIDPDIAELRARMQENRFSKLKVFVGVARSRSARSVTTWTSTRRRQSSGRSPARRSTGCCATYAAGQHSATSSGSPTTLLRVLLP